jgi:ABC-type Zn uptake system ZnuABC Zn-binding protein ZnuA
VRLVRFFRFALVLVLGLVLGCHRAPAGRAQVAVTVFPIYDLVRRVAGPDADVTLLVPPGEAPASFAPSPEARDAVLHARLLVMVGLELDAWAETLPRDPASKARSLRVGDRVPTLTEGEGGRVAPCVWLDPQRARLVVKAIGDELARADSSHANAYRARAGDLDAALDALDREIDRATAAWKARTVAADTQTFAYFAERYHLTLGPDGAGSTPRGARAPVVADRLTDAAAAEAIAHDAGVPFVALDAYGGTAETDSYERLLRYDVAQLSHALR